MISREKEKNGHDFFVNFTGKCRKNLLLYSQSSENGFGWKFCANIPLTNVRVRSIILNYYS